MICTDSSVKIWQYCASNAMCVGIPIRIQSTYTVGWSWIAFHLISRPIDSHRTAIVLHTQMSLQFFTYKITLKSHETRCLKWIFFISLPHTYIFKTMFYLSTTNRASITVIISQLVIYSYKKLKQLTHNHNYPQLALLISLSITTWSCTIHSSRAHSTPGSLALHAPVAAQ